MGIERQGLAVSGLGLIEPPDIAQQVAEIAPPLGRRRVTLDRGAAGRLGLREPFQFPECNAQVAPAVGQVRVEFHRPLAGRVGPGKVLPCDQQTAKIRMERRQVGLEFDGLAKMRFGLVQPPLPIPKLPQVGNRKGVSRRQLDGPQQAFFRFGIGAQIHQLHADGVLGIGRLQGERSGFFKGLDGLRTVFQPGTRQTQVVPGLRQVRRTLQRMPAPFFRSSEFTTRIGRAGRVDVRGKELAEHRNGVGLRHRVRVD
ncbi:MAG: hypothetical protein BWX79_03090 [Alphaproteobacteria bacterium ADurb.Bin100]|nr:MAG: hypothetical protein BWX79_03090 [Alphaproteobacteria bacterium ADurb.Bin100]